MKSGRVALTLAVLLALPAAALGALSLPFDEIDANASLIFIGSNPPSGVNDPNLAIAPLLGVSIPFHLSGRFFLEPGLEFLGWYYEWASPPGAAVITQAENGVGFFTIGVLLSMQGGMTFPLSPVLSFGTAVGVDFLLRFPFEFQNNTSTVQSDESSGLSWFYQSARFIYPETRFFLRWRITDPVDLIVNLRGFYPLFHLWDGAGQPFWDQLMVSFGVGFGIRLK